MFLTLLQKSILNSYKAGQEIYVLSWSPELHHSVHKCLQLDTVMSHLNPIHG
jgi:hypothetical protein